MLNKVSLILLLILPLFIHAQEMWINEIHYDNTGGDEGEFVEVVIQDIMPAVDLSQVEVVFYNGSNSSVYLDFNGPHPLDTFDVGATSNGFSIYSMFIEGIQNGNPDGMALVNNGVVVEFISYEGVITAADGPAMGMTSTDIGVAEPGAIGQSLQLSGAGNQVSLFTWQAPATATKGSLNIGQQFGDFPPKVKSLFPADGTTGVDFETPIVIEFTEPVNFSLSSFNIICGTSIVQNANFSLSADARTVTLAEVNFWSVNQTCNGTLFASNITDTDGGNQLDGDNNGSPGGDFTFSFTVAGDPPVPTVDSVSPADGAVLVPEAFTVDINFNKAVNITSNAIAISCPSAVSYTTTSLSNVSSVTVTPNTPVAQGSFCTVTVNASGVTDSASQLDGDNDGVAGGNYVFGFAIIEPIAEIYEIQGNGESSPIEDSFIRTENNIVTAIRDNGFFMQSPGVGDGDSDTSDGIFVFSDEVVQEGDSVNVRGQVVEFFDLTELTNVSSVVINSSGNALPTEIIFDANTPSQDPSTPTCTAGEFECYEGMLVSVANGMANGATQYSGEFTATATGARAIREPGIEISQINDSQLPAFPSATYDPDIFDENPELFEVDTNGLAGMPILDINGGSTFSASGVLSYSFGSYTLMPKTITVMNKPFAIVDLPAMTEITVATQNMYRFFDGTDDPAIDDFQEDTTTPARFAERVSKASLYFRTIMNAPDIIVLTEIENIGAVQAIADKINVDDNALVYSAHLIEGQDFGGIDIGFLAKSTVSNITITQLGKDETLAFGAPMPPELPRPLHDRPPLLLNGVVTKGGIAREINVLGVHTRSRSGITGSDRERIRNKHFEQAISIANMVQNLQSPTVALVVIGDFNDFEFSDGYADVIGEIKGDADPIKNLFSSNGNSVVNPTLINVVDTLPVEERYSFIFRGTIQVLDHALLNDVGLAYLSKTTFVRGNIDAPEKFEDDYTQTLNMSDHDGLMIYLDLDTTLQTIFLDGFEQ